MRNKRREANLMLRRRQRDVLRDVMLSAQQCETWLTLEELAKLTHYPPASISAQLRHLRKAEYGGFVVEKRCRETGRGVRGEDFGAVWEYRLMQQPRPIPPGERSPRRRAQAAASVAAA